MFKKVGIFILTIISVLCTVGFFRYNPTIHTTNIIPVSADVIVCVNLREMEYNMLKDVVKNPLAYFKLLENNQHKKVISLFDQVVLPSSIFFYTNNNVLKNTWVSTAIEIKNKPKLFSFFKQKGFIKNTLKNAVYFINKKTIYFIHKNELTMLFNLGEITKIQTKLNAVLNTSNYLNDEDSIVQKFKKSKQIVAMSIKNESFLELKIDGDSILITGDLAEENMPFLYKNHENNKNGSLATVSGRIKKYFLFDYLNEKQKTSFQKLTNLSLDSLQTHWNGEFNANLDSFIHQKDTIVTYEYDDDFNKVAKTRIQKTILPDLNISLGGNTLFEYLWSKKAIKNINEENLLVVNPFFKTYASKYKTKLLLFSKELRNASFYNEKEYNNKFLLFFNVEKYLKTQKSSFFIPKHYLAEIKKIKAVITKKNKVNIKICLKKTPQNLMFQLVK